MVIIGNIHLFHDMEGDLKQICLYSGYEYLIAGGGNSLWSGTSSGDPKIPILENSAV